MLRPRDVIRFADKVWYVERSNICSAFVRPFTPVQRAITTRKGITKLVMQHQPGTHIAPTSAVEVIDPSSELAERVRRYFMAEETVAVDAPANTPRAPRAKRTYVRTEKESKQMRGQGAIILAALDEVKQGTIDEITELTKDKFTTRQDAARVVGFYLSKFKREGLVATAGDAAPDAAADAENISQ